MIELKHPDHGYRVTVPDEAVELQQAVWRTGPNGHVDGADDEHFFSPRTRRIRDSSAGTIPRYERPQVPYLQTDRPP